MRDDLTAKEMKQLYLSDLAAVGFDYTAGGMMKSVNRDWDNLYFDEWAKYADEYEEKFFKNGFGPFEEWRKEFKDARDSLERSADIAEDAGRRLNVQNTEKYIAFVKKHVKFLDSLLAES